MNEPSQSGAKQHEPLIDLDALAKRVGRVALGAVVLGLLAAVLAAFTGVNSILSFLFVAAIVLVVGVVALVAVSALKGADRAQKRGERLSGDDVGLLPTRREPSEGP